MTEVQVKRAVLDTSAALELADRKARSHAAVLGGLNRLRAEGFQLHLADGTIVEILAQLADHRLKWADWVCARRHLVRLIDRTEPVLLGGWELLASVGILLDATRNDPRSLQELRAGWKRLVKANGYRQLWKARPHRNEGRWVLGITSREGARLAITTEKNDWKRGLDEVAAEGARQGIGDVKDPEWKKAADAIVRGMDSRSISMGSVPVSTRLDAMVRVYGRFSRMMLQSKSRYNPAKRGNDAFDHDLLRYLALPALICTCDTETLVTAVEASGTWQRKWVLGPDEMQSIGQGGPIPELKWPTREA